MRACTARELRADVELLLNDLLGAYTLLNGFVTPAIAVRAESERLPTGTKVVGLEVIVGRYPEQEPVRQYKNQSMEDQWGIWLIGWDNSADVKGASERLLKYFDDADYQRLNVPKSWGPTNQVKVTVRNPAVFGNVDPKDLDGGYFHPYLVIRATKAPYIVDSGNYNNGDSANTWPNTADGGVFGPAN